jgi:multiple sugar transport system permease protein
MFPTPIERVHRGWRLAYKLSLPLALLIWLLPLIAVMVTSLRSADDIAMGNYWGLPRHWSVVENYTTVFTNSPLLRYFVNSLLITLPTVAFSIGFASMAGFALATYRFRGNVLVLAAFIAGNFIPFQILMIPVRTLTVKLGMFDSITALVLFHTAFQCGFCTLFLRNFIKELPFELIEAARIEGTSEWQLYRKVVLPLVRPALAALAVLVFTFVWNDYFWALTLTQSDEVKPVMLGISSLRGQWLTAWNLISAGSVVAALPAVGMFFAMQKHFIAGLTLGAVKG